MQEFFIDECTVEYGVPGQTTQFKMPLDKTTGTVVTETTEGRRHKALCYSVMSVLDDGKTTRYVVAWDLNLLAIPDIASNIITIKNRKLVLAGVNDGKLNAQIGDQVSAVIVVPSPQLSEAAHAAFQRIRVVAVHIGTTRDGNPVHWRTLSVEPEGDKNVQTKTRGQAS